MIVKLYAMVEITLHIDTDPYDGDRKEALKQELPGAKKDFRESLDNCIRGNTLFNTYFYNLKAVFPRARNKKKK